MINQISQIKTKTESIPKINRSLIQARLIQAHLKERIADGLLPRTGWISRRPFAPATVRATVTRWIE